MTADQRINTTPERLPNNIVPMHERPERRAVPRWIERKEAQGLPVQDATWRVTREVA